MDFRAAKLVLEPIFEADFEDKCLRVEPFDQRAHEGRLWR
jgi:hypothetical protein